MHYSAIGFLSVVLFSILVPAHAGDIFKWVDPQGITHYTDRPPVDKNSVALDAQQLPQLNIGQPAPQLAPIKSRSESRRKPRRQASARVDCSRYRSEISKLEHALRQGYVEPAGSRMRERKRHWTALLYRQCY
jgi:hypothetical protein